MSDQEIRQWHRFLNAHFKLLVEVHVSIKQKEKQISLLQDSLMKCEDDKSRGDDELEPHEKMKRRFRDGEIRDRMQ